MGSSSLESCVMTHNFELSQMALKLNLCRGKRSFQQYLNAHNTVKQAREKTKKPL